MAFIFEHTKHKIYNDVVFCRQNLNESSCDPSKPSGLLANWKNSAKTVHSGTRSSRGTYCLITSRFTFCMSTFLEYSGGNLVLFKSLASTLDMVKIEIECFRKGREADAKQYDYVVERVKG